MDPINYSLILIYGLQMTITFLIGLGAWSVKVRMSSTDMAAWYKANGLQIAISLGLFWLMSAGLVIVPNIAQILGAFGFNADQSAAGIALVIVGFLVGGSSDPGKQKAPDPIP